MRISGLSPIPCSAISHIAGGQATGVRPPGRADGARPAAKRPPRDTVEISPEADREAGPVDSAAANQTDMKLVAQLSEAEQQVVQKLKARDREVRAHEQAHLSAAGPYAQGGPQYEYQTGPDNNRYAVGGSVNIDTSPIPGDPEATLRKAQVIRAAALAPASPSGQDMQVAAAAAKMEAEALAELRQQQSGGGTSAAENDEFVPSGESAEATAPPGESAMPPPGGPYATYKHDRPDLVVHRGEPSSVRGVPGPLPSYGSHRPFEQVDAAYGGTSGAGLLLDLLA